MRRYIGIFIAIVGLILAAPGLLLVHLGAWIDKKEVPW